MNFDHLTGADRGLHTNRSSLNSGLFSFIRINRIHFFEIQEIRLSVGNDFYSISSNIRPLSNFITHHTYETWVKSTRVIHRKGRNHRPSGSHIPEEMDQISIWELKELKQIYGISMQAIVKRANLLGIVSDFYYRNFKLMLKQKGWKKKEPVDYKGREAAIRFRQLLHYAVNEEIITLSRGAEIANKSLVDLRKEVKAAV